MRTKLVVALTAGALGIAVVACSSSTPAPPDQTVAQFCSDWANAYCQLSSECMFDTMTCSTLQTKQCNSFATAAMASGTRQYTQSGGAACISALNSAFGNSPSSV